MGIYALHGPVINVGYGRPDVNKSDEFGGVGSNTNDQRDYPAAELIAEWGGCPMANPACRVKREHAAALKRHRLQCVRPSLRLAPHWWIKLCNIQAQSFAYVVS